LCGASIILIERLSAFAGGPESFAFLLGCAFVVYAVVIFLANPEGLRLHCIGWLIASLCRMEGRVRRSGRPRIERGRNGSHAVSRVHRDMAALEPTVEPHILREAGCSERWPSRRMRHDSSDRLRSGWHAL